MRILNFISDPNTTKQERTRLLLVNLFTIGVGIYVWTLSLKWLAVLLVIPPLVLALINLWYLKRGKPLRH